MHLHIECALLKIKPRHFTYTLNVFSRLAKNFIVWKYKRETHQPTKQTDITLQTLSKQSIGQT